MKDSQIYREHDIICSFSSGRTSALMAKNLITEIGDRPILVFGNKGKPKFKAWNTIYNKRLIIVFTNTGKEREESLIFANKCDLEFNFNLNWLEAIVNNKKGIGSKAKKVNYITASRKGEPFEAIIQKLGIPNSARSKCSSELKTNVVRAFAREIGFRNYYNAVGIRIDEPKRLNFIKAE